MMRDKTALVTGATDGIGKQTALALARLGAQVLAHGRSRARAEAAAEEIRRASANDRVAPIAADFASLRQVREMAGDILAEYERLDVLIHNAGVFMTERRLSEDGMEMTLAVNHIAPFLLTHLLLDLVCRSAPARIIVVSSTTHQSARIDFERLNGPGPFDGHEAYAMSKLANVLFAFELAERLAGSQVTVNALHPGVIDTKLLRTGYGAQGAGVEAGAVTPVYLASSPDVATITGQYFARQRIATPSPLVQDRELRRAVWEASARLAGITSSLSR